MLKGWHNQQTSRALAQTTVDTRTKLIRRFADFAGGYPWDWTAADVEDFTTSLTSEGGGRLSPATIRSYHVTIRLFCDYLTDQRYEWVRICRDRFGRMPSQICHDWNTVAHLIDYEGRPGRRPLSYDELQTLFVDRVDRIANSGRKGAFAALRDAQMLKTAYAYGLRRNELCRLEVVDLRPNPHMPDWGTYGSVHVRFGKRSLNSTGSSQD